LSTSDLINSSMCILSITNGISLKVLKFKHSFHFCCEPLFQPRGLLPEIDPGQTRFGSTFCVVFLSYLWQIYQTANEISRFPSQPILLALAADSNARDSFFDCHYVELEVEPRRRESWSVKLKKREDLLWRKERMQNMFFADMLVYSDWLMIPRACASNLVLPWESRQKCVWVPLSKISFSAFGLTLTIPLSTRSEGWEELLASSTRNNRSHTTKIAESTDRLRNFISKLDFRLASH